MLTPRPYQTAALDALDAHIQTRPGNPCVVIPTGGGKSLLMAMAIQRWKEAAPHFRCMVLAHRKELVRQNHDEMMEVWPEAEAGIYSAGLRRRDIDHPILFASIDSVWNKAAQFPRFDCIIIDECFPPGTIVEGKPIETISVGDEITTYNESKKVFERGTVSKIFKSINRRRVIIAAGGIVIESTWNHPFFTNKGWIPACKVTESMLLLRYEIPTTNMQSVSEGIYSDKSANQKPQETSFIKMVLLKVLPKRNNGNIQTHTQSDVQSTNKKSCFANIKSDALQAVFKGRKWKAASARTSDFGETSELADRICSSNKDSKVKRPWISDLLQIGHRKSRHENRRGNRREQPLLLFQKSPRHKERQSSAWVRVESVSIQEDTSIAKPNEGSQRDYVYNLTVEPNNTYIANGFVVHNCHRIPAAGEGKYRTFIRHFPGATVVGLTGTPYREGAGAICHRDHILNEVCYEANVGDLIRDGYLCKLRSKVGRQQPDLSGVRRLSGGDYVTASLSQAMSEQCVVHEAVSSAVEILTREGRRSIVWFCVDVAHCHAVQIQLAALGIHAPAVTAKTPHGERDTIAAEFKAGKLQHILNVNVYTEGFNARGIDAIVLLRPTLSKGLYAQMVGRGLRQQPGKTDCLILDFAQCIASHGPIDCLGDGGGVSVVECGNCGDTFSKAVKVCPHCGWEYVPPAKAPPAEGASRDRKLHGIEASDLDILGAVQIVKPESVTATRHKKPGKPDSIRVTYHAGLLRVSEWVCLDHPGYAGQKARKWWRDRFPSPPPSVDGALEFLFLPQQILAVTESIEVGREGKYPTVKATNLRKLHERTA